MLVSDPMSGQLHEVPDDPSLGWYGWAEAEPLLLGYSESGQPEVFDGFGNPLGIAPLLAALIPAAASVLPGLLSSLFGRRQQPAPGGLGMWAGDYGGYEAVDYDGYGYGTQVVFDGYGNPVGSIPALQTILPAIGQALPAITQALPQVGRVIQQVLPHAQQFIQAMAPPPGVQAVAAGPPMPPMGPPPPDLESEEEPMEPEGPPPMPYPPGPPPRMMARRPVRRRAMRRRRRRF